jgi:hypothetical protein
VWIRGRCDWIRAALRQPDQLTAENPHQESLARGRRRVPSLVNGKWICEHIIMEMVLHELDGKTIAEVRSEGIIIRSWRDSTAMLADLSSRGIKDLILHEKNLAPEFFDLKTGVAEQVLQKCADGKIRVAIVGDFQKRKSRDMAAFMESNKGNQVGFVATMESAINRLKEVAFTS